MPIPTRSILAAFAALLPALAAHPAAIETPAAAPCVSAEADPRIEQAVQEIVEATGVPGVSLAIVQDRRIACARAWGQASLDPPVPATPDRPYAIGSISKQFTAAALLLLQEDGKLSLDDRLAKYFPGLTGADGITLRQLLSHTAGIQDYWPHDYLPAQMMESVSPQDIMDRWAKGPLDYPPGTQWQYSNTGFVIAAAVVEKVADRPFFAFLEERIFKPLGMTTVVDLDPATGDARLPTGYMRYALGPLRRPPQEGGGWMYGAGSLAMTGEDLSRWNVAMIEQRLLSPASWRAMQIEVLLASGVGARYGLGVSVGRKGQRRVVTHGGEVAGFTAENVVYPDDGVAIAAFVNQDAVGASGQVAEAVAKIVFDRADATDAERTVQARAIFEGLQQGRLDRGLFTANANGYFSEQAIADFQAGLAPLGAPESFEHSRTWARGGMTGRAWDVKAGGKVLRVWTYEMPDGRLEQYQVAIKE